MISGRCEPHRAAETHTENTADQGETSIQKLNLKSFIGQNEGGQWCCLFRFLRAVKGCFSLLFLPLSRGSKSLLQGVISLL